MQNPAILSSILLELGEHKSFGSKVQGKVVGLLKSVNYMRLVRLGLQSVALPALTAYISGGASLVPGPNQYDKSISQYRRKTI